MHCSALTDVHKEVAASFEVRWKILRCKKVCRCFNNIYRRWLTFFKVYMVKIKGFWRFMIYLLSFFHNSLHKLSKSKEENRRPSSMEKLITKSRKKCQHWLQGENWNIITQVKLFTADQLKGESTTFGNDETLMVYTFIVKFNIFSVITDTHFKK